MRNSWRALTAALALVACLAPLAAPARAGSEIHDLPAAAKTWMAGLDKICRESGGRLKIDPKAVTYTELTGDGRQDVVVEYGDNLYCSNMRSAFCGTGGCSLLVVVNGKKPFEFLAKSWETGRLADGRRLLVIGVHWGACDHKPACRQLLLWDRRAQTFNEFGLLWQDPMRPAQD